MRETFEAKGLRYLAQGRLIVLRIDSNEINAVCRGDGAEVYRLGYQRGGFFCDCPARGRCCHLTALMRVTLAPPSRAILAPDLQVGA